MAVAIYIGLNKAENCHRCQYLMLEQERERDRKLSLSLREGVKETESSLAELSGTMRDLLERCSSQATTIEESTAAIEAAHAGHAGKGFAVIADEVKRLAYGSSESSTRIAKSLDGMKSSVSGASSLSLEANAEVLSVMGDVGESVMGLSEVLDLLAESAAGSSQIVQVLKDTRESTEAMRDDYEQIFGPLSSITAAVSGIRRASE